MKKILAVLFLAVFSFGAPGNNQPSLVNTVKVTKGIVNPLEEFIGTLSFSRTSDISAQSSGIVDKINFESGDMVKKGDILVAIDSEILDAQINSAKANLSIAKLDFENAKKDYERYKKLREQKTVSQQTYDNSFLKFNTTQQNILVSESKLKELEVQKTKKFVKAPYDGIIVSKSIEKAEWANAGKVVGTIVDTTSIDLTFNLPTSYVYKLNKDEDYSIKIKDKTISSKLYAAIPKGDSRTRTFPVKFKAKVQNEFLYDGMEAAISLPRNKKQESLVVPRDAVIKRFGQNVVFIDSDSKAVMLPVKIIGYNTTSVAVSAKGLYEGANVVIKGNERIFPNQPIKSLNK